VSRPAPLTGRAIRAIVALPVAVLFFGPVLWVLVTSLSTSSDIYRFPPRLWPTWHFENYVVAWKAANWPRYFGNTVFIATCTVALALVTSLLAGFAFSVMRFRGRGLLFGLVLSVMMVPQTVLLIPDYIIAKQIGWLDTYWIQIIPWGASVFGIFLVRQLFIGVPTELLDAAEMDGAGPLRMLYSIGVPLARPAMILVGLNVFMGSWNAFLWPYVMTSSDDLRPIEVGLQYFYGANGTDWPTLSAAVCFTTLPVLVVFVFLQRYFVTGAYYTQGAVRG
jgi:multiple sugar transport system permease protein